MRSTDRDYFMSTISVLQYQRLLIQSIADDLCIRLDELEHQIAMQFEQKEDEDLDFIVDDAWQAGYDYKMWEEDKIVYDSGRKCKCDDEYEHRMD